MWNSSSSIKVFFRNHPVLFSVRHQSHSAGSSRSTGHKIETLEDVAHYIKSGRARNIIVMCGAGISTASGIPDFRYMCKILTKYRMNFCEVALPLYRSPPPLCIKCKLTVQYITVQCSCIRIVIQYV